MDKITLFLLLLLFSFHSYRISKSLNLIKIPSANKKKRKILKDYKEKKYVVLFTH